jgi:integrase
MEYLNDSELKSLLEVTYEADRVMHMFILTSLVHGLRCSEALSLTVDSIDGGYIHVTALKNGVSRMEPLHISPDPLFDESSLAVHAHGVRTQGGSRLFPMSRATADRRMKYYCGLAGIASGKSHIHAIRHSTAMIVFKRTTSLGAVKQALRQRAFSSALVYLNESDSQKGFDAVRDGLQALSGALEG